jgi:hypothetical protein
VVGAADVLVDGVVRATFDDSGLLQGLDGDETVVGLDRRGDVRDVLRSSVTLRPGASVAGGLSAMEPPADVTVMVGGPVRDMAAERAALLATLDRHLLAGFHLDGHAGFRAVVDALERDDRLVDEVMSRFGRSPARVVDVLVAAGTPAAQRALLARLAIDVDGALVQRLVALRHPEPETLRFLIRLAASDVVATATPTRLALGALAGRGRHDPRLEVQREADRALQLLRQLSDDDALDANDRAIALRALGNCGDVHDGRLADEDTARLLARASDDDARVRAATASALRHGARDDARMALLALAGDEVPSVQASALQALAHHLDEATLAGLADLAAGGAIDRENAGRAVSLVRAHLGVPAARATLEAVVADPRTDPFTEGMARDLLDTTAPAP